MLERFRRLGIDYDTLVLDMIEVVCCPGNSAPSSLSSGVAFTAVSLNSSSGSDSAMIAPPTP